MSEADTIAGGRPIMANVAGNQLDLLAGGQQRLDAILSLIDGAERELRLLFYMLSDDVVGAAVIEALTRAAARGVNVRLLLDGFGCGISDESFLQPLRDAGGAYSIFHPSYGRRYLIRNHQKLAIADDGRALIGGANLDLHYMEDDGDERWRDLWLSVDGPAVAPLGAYFDDVYDWTQTPKNRIRDLRRIIQRHSHGSGPVSWRFSAPMRRRNPFPAALAIAMERAKRFDAVIAYFSPSWPMIRRLYGIAQRGTVRIVNAARSDNQTTVAAARYLYGRLLRRGIQIYEYQPAKLHTKLYIADDVTFIGSSNLDFRSLYINLEMMLRVEDAGFAEQMRGYIDREVADSVQITQAAHKERTTPLNWLKRWIAHWLVTTVDYTVSRRINVGME